MGENSTTFNLTILEEFTKYDIAVAAFNIYGVGNKSDEMTCFTKEDGKIYMIDFFSICCRVPCLFSNNMCQGF